MAQNNPTHLFQARYRPHDGSALIIQLMQQDECFGRMTVEAAEGLRDSLAAAVKTAKADQSLPRPAVDNMRREQSERTISAPLKQAASSLLPPEDKLVTVEDLAVPLRMPVHGLYDLLKKVPPGIVVRLGRRIRIKERAFLDWMNAGGHPIRPHS